ncbi:MAG: HD-GYP domain-containing protein [Candidatus Dormibacteria bacterium]
MGLKVGRGTMNFSAKAYASIGAVYLLGLPAAAVSSIASLIISVVVRRSLDVKTVFNSAMTFLACASAFWVFHEVSQSANLTIGWLLLAGAGGGLATWLSNQTLLGMVMVADQGIRDFRFREFLRHVLDVMPYFVGYGLTGLGVVAASLWLTPIGALITLAAPVAIVQTATNRWMRAQQARAVEAQSGFNATLVSLSKAIDLRDSDTEGHCRRVVEYSLMMGRYLKFSDEDLLRLCHGALLHDIGKIGVPDAILHKPGPLTEDEWTVMRTHPQLGALLVADVRQLEKAREVILAHHERFDGKGYPNGLAGESVPLAARVFTIADAFDAMISDRPYRSAMSLMDARSEVRRCCGTQFDPTAVEAFESISDAELEAVSNKREQPTEELLSL